MLKYSRMRQAGHSVRSLLLYALCHPVPPLGLSMLSVYSRKPQGRPFAVTW